MSPRPTNQLGSDLLLQTGRISHLPYIKASIASVVRGNGFSGRPNVVSTKTILE